MAVDFKIDGGIASSKEATAMPFWQLLLSEDRGGENRLGWDLWGSHTMATDFPTYNQISFCYPSIQGGGKETFFYIRKKSDSTRTPAKKTKKKCQNCQDNLKLQKFLKNCTFSELLENSFFEFFLGLPIRDPRLSKISQYPKMKQIFTHFYRNL